MSALNPKFKTLPAELQVKLQELSALLRRAGRLMVAFSAGVDSTFLVAFAADVLGENNVLAVVGISPSLPTRERKACETLARKIGVKLVEVETCEMDDPDFVANAPNRCYHCKHELFTRLAALAEEHGFDAVASGANADDAGDYRPGLIAGRELGVLNPLMDAGLTKSDIRVASQAMHLPTWNKPAMACLASRIPYGDMVTTEKLRRIEAAEYTLRDLGFAQCRVRDHDPVARIELPAEALPHALNDRQRIVEALRALGYAYVTLDLMGFRSGSMNEVLP